MSNSLQARSQSTSIRMEREFRQRLQTLSRQQLELLVNGPSDSRRAIAWLAVLKHSEFIFAFASEVLRGKLDALDPILRPSDYEHFFSSQVIVHPELGKLATTTREKVRRVVKTMLREAEILVEGANGATIMRPVLPPEVLSAILADSRRWLAGFLVPDNEIARLRGRLNG